MTVFGLQLPSWQAAIVGVLMAVSVAAGLVHWVLVARVSRLRTGSGLADRLAPFGFGGWHIGMLRRTWYPEVALPLRPWVLLTYAISLGAILVVGGLLMAWVIF